MEESTQMLVQRGLLQLCQKVGGRDLENEIYRELIKKGAERPTPHRVYEFEGYLVIDRPFNFGDTNFAYGELTSQESLQLSLSCKGNSDHCRVLACVTQAGNAKSKVSIVSTWIGRREYLEGKTNPQGKCAFSLGSKEESETLIVAMVVPSKRKAVKIELHPAP